MTKILIIWPPKIEYVFSIQKHYTYFGETIAYLDRCPEFNIDVMDGTAFLYSQWDFIEAYSREYDFLVIYTDLHNSMSSIKSANICKSISANTNIIAFGEGTSFAPEVYLENGFDAVIVDPMYEKGIQNYIYFKMGIVDLGQLRGVYFISNDKMVKINDTYTHDISDISFPALDKIPVNQYKKISGRDQLCFSVARGCYYKCRFCRVPVANRYTESRRKIEDIINYIKLVKDDFASIKFIAPTFTANRPWVIQLCKELINAGVNIKWIVTTLIELLDDELVKLMSQAGCIAVAFGLETLYVETQSNIDKKIPTDILLKKVNLLHENNIIPKAFVMLGIPSQTQTEIDEMFKFLKMNNIEIRPKEYYPYENFFTTQSKLALLDFFERDDAYKIAIPGMSKNQFIKYMLDRTSVR
jgi:radical SAM superfamily enzyme YgiQ (UPF0313 family)